MENILYGTAYRNQEPIDLALIKLSPEIIWLKSLQPMVFTNVGVIPAHLIMLLNHSRHRCLCACQLLKFGELFRLFMVCEVKDTTSHQGRVWWATRMGCGEICTYAPPKGHPLAGTMAARVATIIKAAIFQGSDAARRVSTHWCGKCKENDSSGSEFEDTHEYCLQVSSLRM